MEDSRNIIKAIDALTLKVGGEVVDSKNITEAIDHFTTLYGQVKFRGAGNRQYCKISVTNPMAYMYGEIIVMAQNKLLIGNINGNVVNRIIESENKINIITIDQSKGLIIIDSGLTYTHWLVILSSSLAEKGTIEFLSSLN